MGFAGFCVTLALCVALISPAWAEQREPRRGPVTKLVLPRYVSLGSPKINVRRGPGLEYRKDWIYRRPRLPVRIIDEYGDWRLIVDSDDAGGWVYHALLTGRRTALVTAPGIVLQRDPGGVPDTRPCDPDRDRARHAVACAERGVIAELLACTPDWCRIATGGHEGWVPKSAIWGADGDESFGN